MTTKVKKYCGYCGVDNPLEYSFCHSCGSKLMTANFQKGNPGTSFENEVTFKPTNNEDIDDINSENSSQKIILDPKYDLLEQKLLQLINHSGYFVVNNKEHFVQFLKEKESYVLYLDLGVVSNFSYDQLTKVKKMGFVEMDGVLHKPVVLSYEDEVVREIVLQTKEIFENVYHASSEEPFVYDENFDSIQAPQKLVEDEPKTTFLEKALIFAIFIIVINVVFCNNSKMGSSNSTNLNTESTGEENIDLNKLSGQQFTFKSKFYDKELNGIVIHTSNETTYHIFDFMNMTVTQKSQANGKWVSITYPIKGFYEENGLAATTYVLKVGTLGVKEIWFSPDVPNIGYDYEDGSRIACYEITKE